ncbi:hypothetical protein SMICM304S_04995 [Streptomyces microflavus]
MASYNWAPNTLSCSSGAVLIPTARASSSLSMARTMAPALSRWSSSRPRSRRRCATASVAGSSTSSVISRSPKPSRR